MSAPLSFEDMKASRTRVSSIKNLAPVICAVSEEHVAFLSSMPLEFFRVEIHQMFRRAAAYITACELSWHFSKPKSELTAA